MKSILKSLLYAALVMGYAAAILVCEHSQNAMIQRAGDVLIGLLFIFALLYIWACLYVQEICNDEEENDEN